MSKSFIPSLTLLTLLITACVAIGSGTEDFVQTRTVVINSSTDHVEGYFSNPSGITKSRCILTICYPNKLSRGFPDSYTSTTPDVFTLDCKGVDVKVSYVIRGTDVSIINE